MVISELKQMVNDFHTLWMSGDQAIFFQFVSLIIAVFLVYYGALALGNRLLRGRHQLGFEATAVSVRALSFGIGWLSLTILFSEASAWHDMARRFLWVFLTVGILGRGVTRLPWPTTFKWHLQTLLVIAGYGGFWLVPSLLTYNSTLGWWLNGIVIAAMVVLLVRVVWAQRAIVKSLLLSLETAQVGFVFAGVLHLVASVWHWLSLAAAFGVGLASIALGPSVAGFLGLAIAQTAVFLAVALLISRAVESCAALPAFMPGSVATRYPAVAKRVSKWVPRVLRALHVPIAILFAVAVVHAWNVLNVEAIVSSPLGLSVLESLANILLILLLTGVVWLLVMSWIEDRLNPDIGQGAPGSREKTLLTLFKNAAAIAIVVMASMILLAELGMNIGPLIAGAGVIGLAVGFGAQKLVQDIITGIFIQIEDAIHADDYITAAGISGTVERLSLRSIALRDLTGTLHIIPFSSVDLVSNFTRDFGYHLGVYGVAYRENIGEVIEQLHVAYDRLINGSELADAVAGPLEMDGVTALDSSSVNIRVRIRTAPGMQWAVGRAFNRIVKETFDEAGIEIPFPHMTVWFGEDKAGNAPPAPLRILKEE